MPDLSQFRIFACIADNKSFTKGAVVLGLAQPTASRVVRDLEQEWGGPLFYRTGHGVTLTELGEIALTRVRLLLREAEGMTEELRTFGRLPSGLVVVGVSPSLVPVIVPGLVNRLEREAPGIRLRIHEGFSSQIERMRLSGDVDIGVYGRFHERAAKDEGASATSCMALAAPRSAQPMPAEVEFSELGQYKLVMPAAPNRLRTTFDAVARRLQISLNVVVDTDSATAQNEVALHCGCYMIKALETISAGLSRGAYTASLIVNPMIQREIVLVTTQQRPLSRAARTVASCLHAVLNRLPERAR